MDNLTELHKELERLRAAALASDTEYSHQRMIAKAYSHAADLVAELVATVEQARDEAQTKRNQAIRSAHHWGLTTAYDRILGQEDN